MKYQFLFFIATIFVTFSLLAEEPAKKEGNPLNDILNGVAGQALGVFLHEELLKEMDTVTANKLLSMIEGDNFQKRKILEELRKLKNDKDIRIPDDDGKRNIRRWQPFLKELAGEDGYINRADVRPIAKSLYEGGKSEILGGRIQIEIPRAKERLIARIEKKIHFFMDEQGIPEKTPTDKSGPATRDAWPKLKDQVTVNGQIVLPKVLDAYITFTDVVSYTSQLKNKVIFIKGLPLEKMEPAVLKNEIPDKLRLSLDESGKEPKLVIK